MNNTKQWKPVIGFEGRYEVSEDGDVRRPWGTALKPSMSGDRPSYTLCKNSLKYYRSAQRLVAEAFHGPNPDAEVVRHLDGDPLNNHYTNLRWGTYKENTADSIRHGTKPMGVSHPNSKLKPEEVIDIRKRHSAGGISMTKLGREYGVTHGAISRILAGASWAHVT